MCPLAAALAAVGDARASSGPAAYIKDWHMCRDAPAAVAAGNVYRVPLPFADDWLNWFFDARTLAGADGESAADCRFCYIGSARSWTPLHHDVLSSCSWSANVFGWKLWFFIRPPPALPGSAAGSAAATAGTAAADAADSDDSDSDAAAEARFAALAAQSRDPVLHDAWGNLKFSSLLLPDEAEALEAAIADAIGESHDSAAASDAGAATALPPSSVDGLATSSATSGDAFAARRAARAALHREGRLFFCLQPPGSAVFVPPGWYHEVHNIGRVASINHNWFGPASLPHAWAFLHREVEAARESIADCRTVPVRGAPHRDAAGFSAASATRGGASDTATNLCYLCKEQAARSDSSAGIANSCAAAASKPCIIMPAAAAVAAQPTAPESTGLEDCACCAAAAAAVDWDWEAEVQRLVKVNSGFNYEEVSAQAATRIRRTLSCWSWTICDCVVMD